MGRRAVTQYRYEAARSDGALVAGVVEAAGASEAGALLAGRGLHPIRVVVEPVAARPSAPRRDLAVVFRSLATLVGAGVPLDRAMAATEALARGSLRQAMVAARGALREGRSLANGLAASQGVFPPVAVGMIRAGEHGSALAAALAEVATHLEQEADLIGRVRQALAYPLVLAAAGAVSVFVLGAVVIPRFAELLADLGQDLPLATRLLLQGTDLIHGYWFVGVGVLAVTAWGTAVWLRRPTARKHLHGLLLGAPVIGRLRMALASARVARALGGMVSAGMPLLAALDRAGHAAGDSVVTERLARARERVAEGAPLAASLERCAALSVTTLPLVAVGESSGRLGEMLRRAGDVAAQDAERGLRLAVTLLEPALIVLFGGFVAFVALALLQAVYAVRPT